MVILHCSKFRYLHQPLGLLYIFVVVSPGFDFVFSVRDWLGRASPKWSDLLCVERDV